MEDAESAASRRRNQSATGCDDSDDVRAGLTAASRAKFLWAARHSDRTNVVVVDQRQSGIHGLFPGANRSRRLARHRVVHLVRRRHISADGVLAVDTLRSI